MRITKCKGCDLYTLAKQCKVCGTATSHVGPAKYSPQDPYGRYRRMMKRRIEDG